MTDNVISSSHIQKLGHNIQEIRERTLLNIISKLDHGFKFDNDLARSKEILSKLFDWFLFEPCTLHKEVFGLIKCILKSESGQTLIKHHGADCIRKELDQIQTYIEPKFHPSLDEIRQLIESRNEKEIIVVPPLETDIPLSFRTGQSTHRGDSGDHLVGTTATTISGLVQQQSSLADQQICPPPIDSPIDKPAQNSIIEPLRWQSLIEPDRHVLQSVEDSLRNPSKPADLLHSSQFFVDVLLHDFPAEVFLQRPTIVNVFHNLVLNCPSIRVTTAVLNCLLNLTKELQIRINHYNDPCLYVSKDDVNLPVINDGTSSCGTRSISGESTESLDLKFDNDILIKNQRLTFPRYCCTTLRTVMKYLTIKDEKRKSNQIGLNLVLMLADELVRLFGLVLTKDIWNEKPTVMILDIFKDLNETMVVLGDTMDHFRLETCSNDSDLNARVVHICLLNLCANFLEKLIPLPQAGLILPRNLKQALSLSLIDVAVSKLYPKTHRILLSYVQSFSAGLDSDFLNKYKESDKVCRSLTAAARFLKNHKTLGAVEGIKLAKDAVASLEFHKDLNFVRYFIEMCCGKLPLVCERDDLLQDFEDVTLGLLAHTCEEIKVETYTLCQKRVVAAVGPKMNPVEVGVPGSQIMFMLRTEILTEIAMHGVTNSNSQIQKCSEDILIHLLKCKILVSDEIWDRLLQALIPAMPILLCHCGKDSSLKRTLLNLIDPDSAKALDIPEIQILKGNIVLLFSRQSAVREEAFSRLCWLLASVSNSSEMLPKLNNLYDKALPNACQFRRIVDINKQKTNQHFYQPSSLLQVLDLLRSPNVEPVIRRSALTQVSVMMEDPLLHSTFLQRDGLKIVLDVMESALTEKDFSNYPDSVVPAVSVLKSLCLHQSGCRLELSSNGDVYRWVLRGLFMFFAEERLKQDASILLFMLAFHDFVMGSPYKADISIPEFVWKMLQVPFTCRTHWSTSHNTPDSVLDAILGDPWCLSSVQIQWNVEIFGGLEELLSLKKLDYSGKNVVDILKMSQYDLSCLKAASMGHCVKRYLITIQNATTHDLVLDAVHKMMMYIHLYNVSKTDASTLDDILDLGWESTFTRFLKVLPSSEEDANLLDNLLKLLQLLVPLYRCSGKSCWIPQLLKDPSNCLLDLLDADNATTTQETTKHLSHDLLKLITLCITEEQHFLDHYILERQSTTTSNVSSSWKNVIEVIADNLKFSDTTHFYNLAYLDALLSTLVHLTANLGWSSTSNNTSQKILRQLVSSLCELVVVFHGGKGATAAVSVMGLSITRNAVLILNHLLAEIRTNSIFNKSHSRNNNNWEDVFFLDNLERNRLGESGNWLTSFLVLWHSRDVIVRAAALQLFAGLSASHKMACEIVNELKDGRRGVWQLALTILLDHGEASVVRENSALLLSNLLIFTDAHESEIGFTPNSRDRKICDKDFILALLDDFEFYKNLIIILNALHTIDIIEYDSRSLVSFKSPDHSPKELPGSDKSPVSSGSIGIPSITTPSLVKCVAFLLNNLLKVDSNRLLKNLRDQGLVKLIFRCICNPAIDIGDTRRLSLYCEIMEMNIAICSFLTEAASLSLSCLGTILHTRNCLNDLVALLNPKTFHTDLPPLLYLRNKLWGEIYRLLTALVIASDSENYIDRNSTDSLTILAETVFDTGVHPFLNALCEALRSVEYADLQHSALSALITLAGTESQIWSLQSPCLNKPSIQNLLDTCRSTSINTSRRTARSQKSSSSEPKTTAKSLPSSDFIYKMNLMSDLGVGNKENCSNLANRETSTDDYKKTTSELEAQDDEKSADDVAGGVEVCKILLNLFDLSRLKINKDLVKKKSLIVSALTAVLGVSRQAKRFALATNFLDLLVRQLKEFHLKLGLESVDCLRRAQDKRRLCPLLAELEDLVGLITNFLRGEDLAKRKAASLGLADVVHKLWIWFFVQRPHLINCLRMMSTFTADCSAACHSLTLTSSVTGSGPQKAPVKMSFLHATINLIEKEMDQISKAHDLEVLRLCFEILNNCCSLTECRILMSKTDLLKGTARLHPAVTKRQKPWETVESFWLKFLQNFSLYPEGQSTIAKTNDVLDLLILLTSASSASSKSTNRILALTVLRNLAFYHPNRTRLLTSGEFLKILQTKLDHGDDHERALVVLMMWSLCANNQKAKVVFKAAQLHVKLEQILKQHELLKADNEECESVTKEDFARMRCVLRIIKDEEFLAVR